MKLLARVCCGVLLLLGIYGSASASSGSTASPGLGRVVPVHGSTTISGYPASLELAVWVRQGEDEDAVVRAALAAVGAETGGTTGAFEALPLRWRMFFDTNPGNDFVPQSYNPSGQPPGADFLAAVRQAQNGWALESSTFRFKFTGLTPRCPSMIGPCESGPRLDGFNDVGWLPLGDFAPTILGLTAVAYEVATGYIVEADMALDPRFAWFVGEPPSPPTGGNCTSPPPEGTPPAPPSGTPPPPPSGTPPPPPEGSPPPPPEGPPPPEQSPAFDAVTAMLHENGHVAGLEHSNDCEAVMYSQLASLQLKRELRADDVAVISALYPLSYSPVEFEPPSPPEPAPEAGQ